MPPSREFQPRIDAVIFDIDGTLIDSVDLHTLAWQEAFRHFGHEIPFNDIRMQIGKGGDRLIPSLLRKDEASRLMEQLEKYRGELFRRAYLPKVKPFAGVRELFLQLRRDGKRIVLGSSAKGEELAAYKRILDIDDLVEDETSADDADRSKPSPDIFQAALDKLDGVTAARAIVVGDTPYDAQAAGKVGLRTIGVLSGGFPEEDLRRACCCAIYRDVSDLLAQIDSSPLAAEPRAA